MISNEHVSCIAPATETASFQILFNCPTPAIVFEITENPHGLLTFDKVHNPLRRPRKTTSERPKVLRTRQFWKLLTSKCASRHKGVHFFDISSAKSAPTLVCFVHFDLEMCFVPQRRALFRHHNFQKCSDRDVLCTFRLGNVLCPTVATSHLPKVLRPWCVLYILTWKRVSCHKGVQFFISYLATWLRTRHFSEPTFRPSGATNHQKNTVFRDFATFSRTWIFFLLRLSSFFFLLSSFFFPSFLLSFFPSFLLSFFPSLLFSDSSHLCFSSVHIVRSLTSKLPSIKHNRKTNNSQKRRSWGAGFCTWMFQYIWVVILISNAFLFNGNDWFKTFVWPLRPWSASASLFHAANNAYNHTCLGPHREKQTNPGKSKELKQNPPQKKTTLLRAFLLLTQNVVLFSLVFFGVFCFDMEKNKKNIVFFVFWTDMINQNIIFWGFSAF